MTMDPNEVQKQLEKLLMEIEKGKDYKGPWNLPFKVTKDFALDMPWESEEDKKRSRVPPLAKQVFQILVVTKNSDRIVLGRELL